tara:strand:- start:504 stop:725 length:222 start_codon:yes stop_codon:yes gene_type:complete
MGNSCSLLCALNKSNKNNKIHPDDNIVEKPKKKSKKQSSKKSNKKSKKKSNKKSKKIKDISKNETDIIPDTRI